MQFKYRYVDFGTQFRAAAGTRADASAAPEQLHENELAMDVGGVCWGVNGEQRTVIDHHFFWPHGFPSATAAVLHVADRIHERYSALGPDDVMWLVAHRQPDFDAFASMYLARSVLAGQVPHAGWAELGLHPTDWQRSRSEIDWFRPNTMAMSPERRWAVLLAACASCVDNCRPLGSPRHRALHSVLYAALLRGRNYLSTESGATQFFDEVRLALSDDDRQLNPLFDSVLELSLPFSPELALLDRQVEAYERDIKRARRTVVYLQRADTPFGEWYGKVSQTPLVAAESNDFQPRAEQLNPTGHRRRQADAIYLRDPECLLFKEWVRNDTDHSSMGEGFLFSAVAYSDERPGNPFNPTSYFFALDPERSAQRHLYNVWARLQTSEAAALAQQRAGAPLVPAAACRSGFEARAGAAHAPLFDDPWFDGSSYECTIVVAPARGTAIGPPGRASDLSDDPVAQIVQYELELAFLEGDFTVFDFPTSRREPETNIDTVSVADVLRGKSPPARAGSYRFAQVTLGEDVDILHGNVADQVGHLLWRLVDTEGGGGVPSDFTERHLVRKADFVAVWSRHGIVVAAKPSAAARMAATRRLFEELPSLAADVEALIHCSPTDEGVLDKGEMLVRRVAQVKHGLAQPEGNLVRRFFEAIRLDEVLSTLSDIDSAAVGRRQ
ncbi:MAG: hypothetical protein K8T25_12620, partial [Planctomycetia bacterium]|nr:hypothetical protein [Planctomycetia bacterium]